MDFLKTQWKKVLAGVSVLALLSLGLLGMQYPKLPVGFDGLNAQPFTLTTDGANSAATTTEWFGDLNPQVDGVYSLGSPTKSWFSAVIDSISIALGMHLDDDAAISFGNTTLSPDFSMGVNSSDSDKLTLSLGGTLGTTNIRTFDKTTGFVDFTPLTLTSGGTDDHGMSISQTLNDPGAAGGSDVYDALKIGVTKTDVAGWNNVNYLKLAEDGNDFFRIDYTDSEHKVRFVNEQFVQQGSTTAFAFDTVAGSTFGSDVILSVNNAGSPKFVVASTGTLSQFGSLLQVSSGSTDWTLKHSGSKGNLHFQPSGGGSVKVTQTAATSGSDPTFSINGGTHTGLTAGAEVFFTDFNGSDIWTWATGLLALQRFNLVRQPTIAFAGASTVTKAVNVSIAGAPIAGANATITESLALEVESGDSKFGGAVKMLQSQHVGITTVNSATYDLLETDYILHVTYTSTGAVTSLTLPTTQTTEGRIITIKDAGGNAGTNNITIDTGGSETIDGSATAVMSTNYASIDLYSDGSNWFIR